MQDAQGHTENFNRVLTSRGYNGKFVRDVNAAVRNPANQKPGIKDKGQHVYFKIPYIHEGVEQQMRKAITRSGINIRITRENLTLRNLLNKSSSRDNCKIRDCSVNNPALCTKRNVVYHILCSCGLSYIGSTIRMLHTRVKEHMTSPKSAIYEHTHRCPGANYTYSIIQRSPDKVKLRLLEAVEIRHRKPELNRRTEIDEWL